MAFILLFLLFFFFLLFLFHFGRLHWSSYMGNKNLLWVVNRSTRYIISQPIGTIWCVVCALVKGGMFKVEYAKISIDEKLNHAWNCSNIKVTNRVSNFQLKASAYILNEGIKVIFKSVVNCK